MRLRHIFRRLTHTPMFTAIAVATLAIGIGANTAIFSVIEGVLLKPLPYPQPDQLVALDHSAFGDNMAHAGMAPFLYFIYREQNRTLEDVGMWDNGTVTVTGLAEPEQVIELDVTDAVLPLLKVQPILGRVFSRTDDSSASPETVMLTNGYWKARFGGDRSVIGRSMTINGRPMQV